MHSIVGKHNVLSDDVHRLIAGGSPKVDARELLPACKGLGFDDVVEGEVLHGGALDQGLDGAASLKGEAGIGGFEVFLAAVPRGVDVLQRAIVAHKGLYVDDGTAPQKRYAVLQYKLYTYIRNNAKNIIRLLRAYNKNNFHRKLYLSSLSTGRRDIFL